MRWMRSKTPEADRSMDPADPARARDGGDELRLRVQRFIRSAGLLSGDQTPCGKPLPVSHAHALMVLVERGRGGMRPTQQELGSALGIDKSNVARLCRKMVTAGHLKQERGEEDGRMRLLKLTARGRRLAASLERASRDRYQRLIGAVGVEDRKTVLAGLAVLNDALAASSRAYQVGGRRSPP